MIAVIVAVFFFLADIATAATAFYFYYQWTKAKETIVAARLDANRSRARQDAAKKAAKQAEQRCRELIRQVETSLGHTSDALEVARHIEAVGDELRMLTSYVMQPFEMSSGRHELPMDELAEIEP